MEQKGQTGEIVMYQPDETIRLEVRMDHETVWLTQAQMVELFQTTKQNVSLHVGNVFREGELNKERMELLEQRVTRTEEKIDFFVRTSLPPAEGIFYDGQIFDAYRFVADLVRKAKRTIILIDNYVDDTVLSLLDKRQEGVEAIVYTKSVSEQLQLDIKRHNEQYTPIEVQQFNKAHDRFLLIDDEVYHIGASVKDLGKKWFAFTLMHDIKAAELIKKIRN